MQRGVDGEVGENQQSVVVGRDEGKVELSRNPGRRQIPRIVKHIPANSSSPLTLAAPIDIPTQETSLDSQLYCDMCWVRIPSWRMNERESNKRARGVMSGRVYTRVNTAQDRSE